MSDEEISKNANEENMIDNSSVVDIQNTGSITTRSLEKALSGVRGRSEALLNFVFETYYNSDIGIKKYMSLPVSSDTIKIPLTNACLNVLVLFTLISVADDFENKTYNILDEEKVEIDATSKKLVFKHSKGLYNYIEQQFLNRSLDGTQHTPLKNIRKTIQEVRFNNNITEELILISLLQNDVNMKRIKGITKKYNDIINENNTKDISFLKKMKKYANITNININGGCGLPEYTKVSDRLNDSIRYFLYDVVYRTTLSDIDISKGLPLRSGGGNEGEDEGEDEGEVPQGDTSGDSEFDANKLVEFVENYIVSVIDSFKNIVKHNDATPESFFDMDKIIENREDNPIHVREPVFKLLVGECDDIVLDVLKSKLKKHEKKIHTNMKNLSKEQLKNAIERLERPLEDFSERRQQIKGLLELFSSIDSIDGNSVDSILSNDSVTDVEGINNYFYDLYSSPEEDGIQQQLNAKLESNDSIMKAVSAFKFEENEIIKDNVNELRLKVIKIMVRNVEKYILVQLNKALNKVITIEKKTSMLGKGRRRRTKKKTQKNTKGKQNKKQSKKHN